MSDYGTDILEWSEHQALLLRHIAAGERLPANDTPDWTNIIDEVESVGRSQVDAVESLLFQALVHMLKAEGWPLSRDVENWRGDARGFRLQARRRYQKSMREKLDVPGLYADALQALPTSMDGLPPLPLSDVCPVTLEEMLSDPA